MKRGNVWLQLVLGWLPMWAFYSYMTSASSGVPPVTAALFGLRAITAAAILGFAVWKYVGRVPWPRRITPVFLGVHAVGGAVYAVAWVVAVQLMETVFGAAGAPIEWGHVAQYGTRAAMGLWLYATVAVVSYTMRATEQAREAEARAARAETEATKAQLSALRGQLNPHFLFNALHSVVHLIKQDPAAAERAAEQLGSLLRQVLDDTRQYVRVVDEWAFVERYLEIEQLRFNSRLTVDTDFPPDTLECEIPSFAIQTLVENAVRHGAAHRVTPTHIAVSARCYDGMLEVSVADDGAGADPTRLLNTRGVGLRGLRQRLEQEYDGRARLVIETAPGAGFRARVVIPMADGESVGMRRA